MKKKQSRKLEIWQCKGADRGIEMTRPTQKRIMAAMLAGAGFVVVNLPSVPAIAEGSIVIREFVLSHGVQDREPISDTDSFHVTDGKAFAFARIQNSGFPTTVSFVWEYGDKTYATIPVNIGSSPGWRTWSAAKLRSGSWSVKLVDTQGDVLLEKSFNVASKSDGPVAIPEDGMQVDQREMAGWGKSTGTNGISAMYDFLKR